MIICLFIHVSKYLNIYLSISIYLSRYLSICLSICLCIFVSTCLSIFLSIYLLRTYISIYLSIIARKKSAFWQLVAVIKWPKTTKNSQKRRKMAKDPKSKEILSWTASVFFWLPSFLNFFSRYAINISIYLPINLPYTFLFWTWVRRYHTRVQDLLLNGWPEKLDLRSVWVFFLLFSNVSKRGA